MESAPIECAKLAYRDWARSDLDRYGGERFRLDAQRAAMACALAKNPGWGQALGADGALAQPLADWLKGDPQALAAARAGAERELMAAASAAKPARRRGSRL